MTPTTLQALRRLLFFSQPEAAQLIGSVSERSWRFWEDGSRTIPPDVIERIGQLVAWREQELLATRTTYHAYPNVMLIWYGSAEDWLTLPGRELIFWRPHCSVIAQLCAEGAVAMAFDAAAYTAWLGSRKDSEARRSQWVSEYLAKV
jgi:predicted DNA-binding transcriptional regulator AlpA